MEYSHIQQLTEDFGTHDTLDFKFDSLMDIAEHFRMDDREDMKRGLEEILRDKLKSLISEYEKKLKSLTSEYEARVVKLKNTAATLRSSNY